MATLQPPLVLGPDDGRLVSAGDFANADSVEPWKYERVDGRLVVIAPDGFDHQVSSYSWLQRLFTYAEHHRYIVEHVFPNPWVQIGRKQDRIGDIGVYLVREQPGPKLPERPPDLMFEMVSPRRKDRDRDCVKKRRDYH
jgi:Uma2 family endonuclease